MLSVAIMSVRKDFTGRVLNERILKALPEDPQVILADLGQLIGKTLAADPSFSKFCEEYAGKEVPTDAVYRRRPRMDLPGTDFQDANV